MLMVLAFLIFEVIEIKRSLQKVKNAPNFNVPLYILPSFGFDRLKSDLEWISFVLYVGDLSARNELGYGEALQRLDRITALDPSFITPYWYVGTLLGGDLKNPSAAATILDRGIQANPDNWYLYYIAGFNQYLWAHDEIRASKYYAKAATLPGAPEWMMRQAQILSAQIPSTLKRINVLESILETGKGGVDLSRVKNELIRLYTHVLQTTPNQKQKAAMAERLRELQVSK